MVVLLVSLYRITRGRRRAPFRFGLTSSHSEVDVESWLQHGPTDDAEPNVTAADRYSPAVATNGKAHHHNGEHPAEPGGHAE